MKGLKICLEKNQTFYTLAISAVIALVASYSNHFTNSFHFDDFHTIVNNTAIRQFQVLDFFSNPETFSSLSTNRSYRPLTTLENSLDYAIGGLYTAPYHTHIFLMFLGVCFLVFLMVNRMLHDKHKPNRNRYLALLCASAFGFNCVNAETVNYIIQRAEITATFFILLAFFVFLNSKYWRRKGLYLLFVLFGFLSKEIAFVFAPLLFLYVLLLEEQAYLLEFYRRKEIQKCLNALRKTWPAVALTFLYLLFYFQMLPDTFSPGNISRYNYIITQPFVFGHYVLTYFIPYNLSADTDWMPFQSVLDYRAIIGIIVFLFFLFIALRASKQKETRIVSFGMLWFIIGLLPTSSFVPFAEVLNDHRTFLPYIGLTIAVVFGIRFLWERHLPKTLYQHKLKTFASFFLIVFFGLHFYGITQRNSVWKNELSLWEDVVKKCPENGRGHMNYGVALLGSGDYQKAKNCFEKALTLLPSYSNIHINLGIAKEHLSDLAGAERSFKKGLALNPNQHTSLYFYGRFLKQQQRFEEARKCLKKASVLAPSFQHSSNLLLEVYHEIKNWHALVELSSKRLSAQKNDGLAQKYLDIGLNKKPLLQVLQEELSQSPSAENHLKVSEVYYRQNRFAQSLHHAKKTLEIKHHFPSALNQMGLAYFKLGNRRMALMAFQQALTQNPDLINARNYVAIIKGEKKTHLVQNKLATTAQIEP
ncbi:tetratricopeptide repeat protein [Flagellimonas allohymeniacidonis]|uniref:Tetratricopeptide repeat protein n=1 Tax=Flagellimonas allohymeniacidonis TaxID=2517819 RepID=A0A4Q8QDR7_9FLAO|nr:tetratricopeptide repeat protein [Allomuricauda hymeniacidonis]TAI46603.1 tetratricopeptide repeat protein [Allomuricauda hymeniacidonis]